MTTGRLLFHLVEGAVLVFLANEAFHASVGLVHVGRNRRLDVLRVVDLVHDVVSVRFHILDNPTGQRLRSLVVPNPSRITIITHIDLVVRPCIHAQGFDLGDMCAQLAMQRRTSHANKDSNLFMYSNQYILSFHTKRKSALHVCMYGIRLTRDVRSN